MSTTNLSIWADERNVELLKVLVADPRRYSSTDIAIKMSDATRQNITRNAIIGKCKRMGIALQQESSQSIIGNRRRGNPNHSRLKPKTEAVWSHQKPHRVFVFREDGALRKPPEPLPCDPDYVPPVGQRKTIMELTPAHCRYIYGEPGQSYFYCGGQVERGTSYCLHHDRLCRPGAYSYRYMEAAE